jgi:hypothetical protein
VGRRIDQGNNESPYFADEFHARVTTRTVMLRRLSSEVASRCNLRAAISCSDVGLQGAALRAFATGLLSHKTYNDTYLSLA